MAEQTAVQITAEQAAQIALESMFACIREHKSFRLEAGAGAGKTYSLVKALQFVIDEQATALEKHNQRVACITYTNVASRQITSQIDHHPVIYSSTIHSFCWSLISCFQPFLRDKLPTLDHWQERLDKIGGIGNRQVDYDLGHRLANPGDTSVFLGHDDVLVLAVSLMKERKFRDILTSRFPILFIDEYQDTNLAFAQSLLTHFIDTGTGPLIGMFGDSWQKIYGEGCGLIDHESLCVIGKKANFRSVNAIVDVLNRMRPDLPQYVKDPDAKGTVIVYHTNDWGGTRRAEAHWAGDLPAQDAHIYLRAVKERLRAQGWDFTPQTTKILMLTHKILAAEQGYSGIADAFRDNDAFAKKDSPHIAFLVDVVDPICVAYRYGRFGKMLDLLGIRSLAITSRDDKLERANAMDKLLELRETGTIGQILDYARDTGCPPLPESVRDAEVKLSCASVQEINDSPALMEISKLRDVSYREIIELSQYLSEHSLFSTKHGVKGAEFDNVLVVLGRGWNLYNWDNFLEWSGKGVPSDKLERYQRNRNLFYVACSRPKQRLALFFTQKLSVAALETLSHWFGESAIESIVSEKQ